MSDWERVPYGTGILYRVGPIRRIGIFVDDLKRTSTGIRGWVELHLLGEDDFGNPGFPEGTPIHFASYDLTGSRTVAGILAGWRQANLGPNRLEDHWVTASLYDAIETVKQGPGDPVSLAGGQTATGPKFLIEPLWGAVGATRLIATGGSGKSFLALAMALSVACDTGQVLGTRRPTRTGPVLYLDWEADADTHSQRLAGLITGAGVHPSAADKILYLDMRSHGPLHRTAPAIRRQVDRHDVAGLIVDSVMLARGSSGDGPAEESTIRLYEALDLIGPPALLIDHKSKAQADSKSRKGGYGSVVMDNQARNVWDVTRTFSLADGRRLELEHTKANNTRLYEPQAFDLHFDGDRAWFSPSTPLSGWGHSVETAGDKVVRALIAGGPLTATDLAAVTELAPATIRRAVTKDPRIVVIARGDSNRKLYGLADGTQPPTLEAVTDGLPVPF